MTGAAGHIVFALAGALIGGVIAWFVIPSLFWACLIGGAMAGGALRVGWVLAFADEGSGHE